ncbi:hypothetical protein BDW74DRAFT_164757 [Aspergillus multicolor]|uniref:glycoside hydrolase family 115 protein n=1 Tax=Aspergillus multicolor TaxID=41759 RepID=UPI003CCD6721
MYAPLFASDTPSQGAIAIQHASIYVDADDFEAIHIAVGSLAEDFSRVTGKKAPRIITCASGNILAPTAIIVGSMAQSSLIRQLSDYEKLDLSELEGKWECYTTKIVENPIPGVEKALVIAGSDKRGAIYGVYTLSEQIGVSPWYWWADAPVKESTTIYALDVTTKTGPPSAKYRGIFINDEAPSLAGWLHEKIGPHFNAEFYKRVYELLLRLKANFLWPAMWFGFPHPGSNFFMDDPVNQETANRYGIVIGTSHHEPMQRAMNEWFDRPYFEPDGRAQRAKDYESFITMGMRGQGDVPMDADDPTAIVKEVLSTQRKAIAEAYGKEDAVPQLMALYKEVQEYYENGLQIPDDITLLFADDNYGTIRRLPSGDEANRRGRAGIYYHLEYVGVPRSYKWLNSNSCAKVWQQLELAYNRGADQVWIFSVGDLKPMELLLTFVLTLAWDMKVLEMDQLPSFFNTFCQRTLNLFDEDAIVCSEMLLKYDRLVALRKHEHIERDTFSIINYGEADRILGQWKALLDQAEELQKRIPAPALPCYFQLILHPIKASYIYVALRIAQAKNQLYAVQRRNTANALAHEVLRLFNEDFDLSQEYHVLLNGKWNHIMRQPHYGYTETWHAPARDMISGLSFVQTRQDSNPVLGYIGVAVEGHPGVRPGLINEESDQTHPSRRDLVPGVTLPPLEPYGSKTRYFEIYCRGSKAVSWSITSPYEWLSVSPASGTIEPKGEDKVVEMSVDWTKVPQGFGDELLLDLCSSLGDFEQVHVSVRNRVPPAHTKGFIEADGCVSIDATSIIKVHPLPTAYRILPYLGRTKNGAVALAAKSPSTHSELLEYPFITFNPAPIATLILDFTLTLDTDPVQPITYQIQLDGENDPRSLSTDNLVGPSPSPGQLPEDWEASVMDGVWKRRHTVNLSVPGQHVLRIRLGARHCVLEKIVIDLGGLRESYLGPPESVFYEGVKEGSM